MPESSISVEEKRKQEIDEWGKERAKLDKANRDIILNCALSSPVDAEKDIAWTLRYAQEKNPEAGINTCAMGIAICCCGLTVQEYLPKWIRDKAGSYYKKDKNPDPVANWVKAQKEFVSHLPIAYSAGQYRPPWEWDKKGNNSK